MKSSSAKKNMNQALALGSRPITRKKLPKLPLRTFDGWFTATQGVTTVDDKVSEWRNLAPGGANLTQSTANLRPAVSTINGLTALAPDGESGRGAATDVLTEGAMLDDIGTGDFYIGMVYELETAGPFGTRTTIIQKQDGSGSNAFNIQISTVLDFRIGASVPYSASSVLELNKTTFLEIVRTDGVMKTYVNGTEVKSANFTTDLSCDGDLRIGASDMKIGEFICKKGTMPDRTRQVIEALMATKWNIGSASTAIARNRASGFGILPAANKFRNRPPRF